MAKSAAAVSPAERRRQQTLERRKHTAAEIVESPTAPAQPQLPAAAEDLARAVPRELVQQDLIQFDPSNQLHIAFYDPSLIAPNPQRARLEEQGIDELAASLDKHGQQEPILARLITPADRKRWPDAFRSDQLLVVLKGHRILAAQPLSKLAKLKVELMLHEDGESDLEYSRRALRRASIKMMHSQGYTIFDKVNLYLIWRQEFALAEPKDTDVAAYFQISRTEAQRVKTVSEIDPKVQSAILRAQRKPADEVIFTIASRPREQQLDAFRQYGHLTVAAVRRLEQQTKPAPETASGRPRNFMLRLHDSDGGIVAIATSLTPQQWKLRGGARAFWNAIQALGNDRVVQDRLQDELG